MDAVSLKLARNYTNEKLNSLPSNAPTKTVTFDGGIYSVGNDVVNGQVSDIVVKGLTATNIINNGNFANGTSGWLGVNATISMSNNIMQVVPDGSANIGWLAQNTSYSIFPSRKYFIKAKLRVTNNDCVRMRALIRSTGGSGDSTYTITAPVANQWYSLAIILDSQATHAGNFRLLFAHEYTDASTANGKVMEVQEVLAIDMTAAGLDTLTADEMNAKFPHWFDGTKSTNSVRVKSVGKNLFSPDMALSYDWQDGKKIWQVKASSDVLEYNINRYGIWGRVGSTTAIPKQIGTLPKFVNGKTYTFTFSSSVGKRLYYTDGSYTIFSGNIVTSDPAKTIQYIALWEGSDYKIDEIQIEPGDTATEYEPYKESSATINLSEPLRSLPNGVKDEVNVTSGVKTQRVSGEYVLREEDFQTFSSPEDWNIDIVYLKELNNQLVSSGTATKLGQVLFKTSIPEIALSERQTAYAPCYYHSATGLVTIGVPKGTYTTITQAQADLAGTTLTYQLATPIVTKLPAQAPLQVFENGTVYVEPMGDPAESTVPSVEMTIPTGNSNKFGVASHDYDGAAADWALTNNESKCFLLAVSNAGGAANIIAPNRPGTMYAISNASGYAITIKKSGGTGVAIATGKTALVIHSGTDYIKITGEV
ncbi:hypothetical protein ACU70A_06310 [Syntrophomonas erecta subsp. sporosyntropha]